MWAAKHNYLKTFTKNTIQHYEIIKQKGTEPGRQIHSTIGETKRLNIYNSGINNNKLLKDFSSTT